jgi:phosphomevalonate kinase
MLNRLLILTILIFVAASTQVFAQRTGASQSNAADASKRSSYDRDKDPEMSESMIETRYRWRKRAEEKEFKENVARTDTAARLCDELNKSFAQNNRLLATDAVKLEELEKLVKKIRKNLGGDDDEKQSESLPSTLGDALTKLNEHSAVLQEELKDSSMYELSAEAIEKTNEMLELIVLIRRLSVN